ncbi:MAG TPA: SpoIIE family protein phosphatase [Bryobacteraceae bacterium]|nr:SpoIIE family protein phosphatase [Bryobacteraceae bacterium]
MDARIEITDERGSTRVVALAGGALTVGRSPDNALAYPNDARLSRWHLRFDPQPGGWAVTDLGSKNGTLLNGTRLSAPAQLKPGDRIHAGQLSIDFAANAPVAAPPIYDDTEKPLRPDMTFAVRLDTILPASGALAPVFGREDAAARRMAALIEAGRELAGHRPLDELFPLILQLAARAVGASRGMVITCSDGSLTPRAAMGAGLKVSRAVTEQVLRDRTSMLVRDTSADQALAGSMTIVAQRVKSLMAAPLQTKDDVIGLVYVDSPGIVRDFTPEDLNLLTVMANIAAVRLEHARLVEIEQAERVMARDMEQAAEIQRSLLPAETPVLGLFEIAARTLPCRSVGGDYYDYAWAPDGRFVFVVADASGKGVPASLLISSMQARLLTLIEENLPLGEMAARLNRGLTAKCPGNRFVTVFIACLDTATGEIEYTNAGHNPPLLVRASGAVEQLDTGGPVMGLIGVAPYFSARIQMNAGDLLLAFSDGVTEAVNTAYEEFSDERLQGLGIELRGRAPADIVEVICDAVNRFAGRMPQSDDITALALKRSE